MKESHQTCDPSDEQIDVTGGKQKSTETDDCKNQPNGLSKCASYCDVVCRLDAFLEKYTRWASSSFNTDKGIKIITYVVWLLSRLTASSSKTTCDNEIKSNDAMSTGLRKVYGHLIMVRYALRLFGLPMSFEAVRTGSWYSGWKDNYINFLGKVMTWSMVFYHPYEHVAYLHWLAPELIKVDAGRCSAISCRFWLAYVFADLASSFLKIKELIIRRDDAQRNLTDDTVSPFLLLVSFFIDKAIYLLLCLPFVVICWYTGKSSEEKKRTKLMQ